MKFTKNFNFKKPEPLDTVNINDLNDSFDMIDEKLKETEEENKKLNTTFKELIINAGNSNAEIVDARGQGFDTLGDRLNNSDSEMNNLDNRVEKIESLKIQDEVEMSTENGYIVCENTNNGQIEDLKIEGNTLVNLWGNKSSDFTLTGQSIFDSSAKCIEITSTSNRFSSCFSNTQNLFKPNTEYTVITEVLKNTFSYSASLKISSDPGGTSNIGVFSTFATIQGGFIGVNVVKLTTISDFSGVDTGLRTYMDNVGLEVGKVIKFRITILEGDYTNNYPNFFTGIKSVGDLEDLSIHSINDNLFDEDSVIYGVSIGLNGVIGSVENWCHSPKYIPVKKGVTYYIKKGESISTTGENDGYIYVHQYLSDLSYYDRIDLSTTGTSFTPTIDGFVRLSMKYSKLINFGIYYDDSAIYKKHSSNNKRALFKNKSGNYEKIVLRGLIDGLKDTTEKHSDGKYYYHKRYEETVLNGNENWVYYNNNNATYVSFTLDTVISNMKGVSNTAELGALTSDLFKSITQDEIYNNTNGEGIGITTTKKFSINILKSKLSSQDLSGFKKWLQTNPITVVYELATEEIYECVNIDLDSYEGKTLLICNSEITPFNMLFKISNHISNTVEVMKDRIDDAENKIIKILKLDIMQKLATTGYQVLPGGLILQWGEINITPEGSNVVTSRSVTFPISFPSRCSCIVVTPKSISPEKLTCSQYDATTSNAKIYMTRTNTTETTFGWLAVGY